MELTILSAKDYSKKLRAALWQNGRMGFSEATARHLGFGKESFIKFAHDRNGNLYLINCKGNYDEDAFKVLSVGKYFSVNTTGFFDALGYDYRDNSILFDMVRVKDVDDEIYKLIKRIKPRKQKTE